MPAIDPRHHWLSENFCLADFLGNHSVYSKGLANPAPTDDLRLANATALCNEMLEPIFGILGPMSISYGYISPEVSRRIVTYQDPDKPSHHRFDLGAAADVCVHDWVLGKCADDLAGMPWASAPITLAHEIDSGMGLPYSRMITYSESPYICVAASHKEILEGNPRRALYENRYEGQTKAKPKYLTYSSDSAKRNAYNRLIAEGLKHPWQGAGHPTYHGGGFEQYHHMRVSKYTMVSDWLFHLKSISEGQKNIPSLNLEEVQDSLAAAGIIFDWVVATVQSGRVRVAEGYLSHHNTHFSKANDWRSGTIRLLLSHPDLDVLLGTCLEYTDPAGSVEFREHEGFMEVLIDVEQVLHSVYWE